MNTRKYKTGQLLVQLGNAVTWFRNQKMQELEITSSQSGVIQYIQKHPDRKITAGELMVQLNLSKPTVSGILKLLEKKSFLIRHTDKVDARKSIIKPTKKCLQLEEELREIVLQTEDTLLQGMNEDEQEQLNRLLEVALNNMNAFRMSASQKIKTKTTDGRNYS